MVTMAKGMMGSTGGIPGLKKTMSLEDRKLNTDFFYLLQESEEM